MMRYVLERESFRIRPKRGHKVYYIRDVSGPLCREACEGLLEPIPALTGRKAGHTDSHARTFGISNLPDCPAGELNPPSCSEGRGGLLEPIPAVIGRKAGYTLPEAPFVLAILKIIHEGMHSMEDRARSHPTA
ncbi:hypothetical protein AOLI_G00310510 [Acnodon oligacanthus]